MLGFHANDEERCADFVVHGKLIISENDLEYLGTGMYFWDCKSRAEYWKETKNKERIVSAIINIDDEDRVLNLNDKEYRKRLTQIFDKINRALSYNIKSKMEKYNLTLDECIGVKLDIIFNRCKELSDNIDVVKGIYSKESDGNVFFKNTNFESVYTEIVSVRHQRPISDRRWADVK